MVDINEIQCALQLHDKAVLSKEQLGKLLFIDLETGKMSYEWDSIEKFIKKQVLMQLYDKGLISEESLLKQTFDLV
ncbi:unnamed protein product, partial [marine sediment metagenome]